MLDRFCVVAVEGATHRFDKPYSYRFDKFSDEGDLRGRFCMVPFGRGDRPRLGVILGFEEKDPTTQGLEKIKSLQAVSPPEHALTEEQISLCEFLKEQYFCGFFDAVRVVIPLPFLYKIESKDGVHRLVRRKKSEPKSVEVSPPVLKEPINLSKSQQSVFDAICPKADNPDSKPALLYGVTSSGKTAIFIKLIERLTARGNSAMLLLPEISLATQMAKRFTQLFGESVALVHSSLSDGERAMYYKGIAEGKYKIVVGTRTAVFSPMKNLGIIIIDEEQENSYKSDQTPRFSTVSVATYRARQAKALLLLASATPSISAYYYAEKGHFHYYELLTRYNDLPLPKAELCDLRTLRETGEVSSVGSYLSSEIDKNLKSGEQTILLLNRRGYRTVGLCKECRSAKTCGSCSVPMVLHKKRQQLLCHYCGSSEDPSLVRCNICGGELIFSGVGTEHVELELADRFPDAGILRMDTDSVTAKNSHERMLASFGDHEADIMVGTQMVAKGLDFEKVTLVGVLSVDSLLYADSYRAYENVFSLVTQVVGRSGRKGGEGRAIIETFNPDHWVLQLAAQQDYKEFYKRELEMRELGLYPPFCTLLLISFVSISEEKAQRVAIAFRTAIKTAHGKKENSDIPLRVLGPASYNVATVAGKTRVKLTLKCRNSERFRDFLREVLAEMADKKIDSGVSIYIDFNSREEQ